MEIEIEEGLEVSHFKEQVKVSRCIVIRSGEGDGSSLHRLKKCVCVAESKKRNDI